MPTNQSTENCGGFQETALAAREVFGSSEGSKTLLESAMMTAADLGAVTKPWSVHRHVSQLIAEEFWNQVNLTIV